MTRDDIADVSLTDQPSCTCGTNPVLAFWLDRLIPREQHICSLLDASGHAATKFHSVSRISCPCAD